MTTGGPAYIKEANKMIYKLIEKHQEDVAFKVFQTLPKNDFSSTKRGNFFLQALINCNTVIYFSLFFCKVNKLHYQYVIINKFI